MPVTFSQADAGIGPLTYAWTYGDGRTSTGGLNPTYTYQGPGNFTAQLTVTDALLVPVSSSVAVTDIDVPPTISLIVPSTGTTGSTINFTAARSTTPRRFNRWVSRTSGASATEQQRQAPT